MGWGGEMAKLQCRCGHAILCKVRCLGERLGTLTFFDAELMSETHGERVESCPSCGEHLEFFRLLLKN